MLATPSFYLQLQGFSRLLCLEYALISQRPQFAQSQPQEYFPDFRRLALLLIWKNTNIRMPEIMPIFSKFAESHSNMETPPVISGFRHNDFSGQLQLTPLPGSTPNCCARGGRSSRIVVRNA